MESHVSTVEPAVEPSPAPGPVGEPLGICQICGARLQPELSVLCRVCGEPALLWGWAP